MKILIGSVFSATGEPRLLDLQLAFLHQTTKHHFEHVSYLTEDANSTHYLGHHNSTVVGQSQVKHTDPSRSHLNGLLGLLKYFQTVDYDLYLILDSDAFPIKQGWDQTCINILNDYDVISCIRTENLDTFLHPSICAFTDPSLVDFQRLDNINLMGTKTSDNQVVLLKPQTSSKPWKQWPDNAKAFPLIRTNRVNLHPIIAAIYGDLFYHHGCGSRSQILRTDPYYNKLDINHECAQDLMDQMFTNPHEYLAKLLRSQ